MHPLGVLDSGGRPTEVIIDKDTRYGINAYDYFVEKIGRTPRTTEKVHFIVATDVAVVAAATNTPAIDFDNRWTTNNKVTLTNYGFILGRGGKAGTGAVANNRNYTFGAKSGNANVTGAQFIPAKAGGNGGQALRNSSTTKIIINNNKLIASGGGGGGGSGAWTSDKQNDGYSTAQIKNNITYTNSLTGVREEIRVYSNGGGSTGTAGSPLGDWTPHTFTIDWWKRSFELGSKEQRFITSVTNQMSFQVDPTPNTMWNSNYAFNGNDAFRGRIARASNLNALNYINNANRLEVFDQAILAKTFDILKIPGVHHTGQDVGTRGIKKISHQLSIPGWHVSHVNNNVFTLKKNWGANFAGDVNVKIRPEELSIYENLIVHAPYTNNADPNSVKVGGWAINAWITSNRANVFSGFGTSCPPKYVGLFDTGTSGYPGASHFRCSGNTGNRGLPSNLYLFDGFVARDYLKKETDHPGASLSNGVYRFMRYHMVESKTHIDAQGFLARRYKEEDYYSGGKGGVLGDDGQAGTLNKIFGWDRPGIPNFGTRFNIPPQYANIFYITEPANGGKGGRIWTGNITINNINGGIMRGYTNATDKVLPVVPTAFASKLNSKFVKPVEFIFTLNGNFIPGFDPYDWKAHILLHERTAAGGDGLIIHEKASRKLGKQVYVRTKNLIVDSGIYRRIQPDVFAMFPDADWKIVIPAGYMTGSHIPGADAFAAKYGAGAVGMVNIVTYLVETLKILRDGVYYLIPPSEIDTVIRYLGPSSYGLSPHAVNELIDLKNRFMGANITSDMNVTGVPTRVVNGQTQYLIAEYNVRFSRANSGFNLIIKRIISSILVSQTSIASKFNLPLFSGTDMTRAETITLPSNIDFEIIPAPGQGEHIRKVNDTTYTIPPLMMYEGDVKVKYWVKSLQPVDKCIVDIEKQKLVRDAIECYRQTGKWE